MGIMEEWNIRLKKNLFPHYSIIPAFHSSGGAYSNIPIYPENYFFMNNRPMNPEEVVRHLKAITNFSIRDSLRWHSLKYHKKINAISVNKDLLNRSDLGEWVVRSYYDGTDFLVLLGEKLESVELSHPCDVYDSDYQPDTPKITLEK
jgi:hypothetical protein